MICNSLDARDFDTQVHTNNNKMTHAGYSTCCRLQSDGRQKGRDQLNHLREPSVLCDEPVTLNREISLLSDIIVIENVKNTIFRISCAHHSAYSKIDPAHLTAGERKRSEVGSIEN